MGVREKFDGQQAGGWNNYPDRVTKKIFFGSKSTKSKPATVLSGQVIKAYTFLESDALGKLKVHSGFNEGALVTFAAITSGQTLILGGLTFTAGASGTTAIQLATAWSTAALGDTAAAATTKIAAAGITAAMGTFTAGTLAGWETELYGPTKVVFNSSVAGTNPTDLADTGTATDPTISTIQGETALNKIAGVTIYDVDGTAGDVDVEVYTEAHFWGDDDGTTALLWATDTSEVITKSDGTTVACTAYNTGCSGTSKASNLLKRKFVEESEFEIQIVNAGDRS